MFLELNIFLESADKYITPKKMKSKGEGKKDEEIKSSEKF